MEHALHAAAISNVIAPDSSFQLTDFDRSFLSALYHAPIDMSAAAKRAMMRSAMKKSLSKSPVPPKAKSVTTMAFIHQLPNSRCPQQDREMALLSRRIM